MAQTLFDKVWNKHVLTGKEGEPQLLYIDLHLIHEVTSPQAFEGLRLQKRQLRRPDLTLQLLIIMFLQSIYLILEMKLLINRLRLYRKTPKILVYIFLIWVQMSKVSFIW